VKSRATARHHDVREDHDVHEELTASISIRALFAVLVGFVNIVSGVRDSTPQFASSVIRL
jgi:hypothetical protein